MAVTMDKAGRLVIPKSVRQAAGLKPGIELDVRCRDGVVEIQPRHSGARLEYRGGLLVAVADGAPIVTAEEIDKMIESIRAEGLSSIGFDNADRA